MHTNWDIGGAFLIALIVSYGFTPFVRKMALRFNALDRPEKKKAHTHPTPLLGGIVIYMAFLASIVFSIEIDRTLLGIFIGASLLLLLGLIDDKFGMLPQLKLSVQVLAGLTVFKFGLRVATIEDYYLSMFFTIFWIVGITNAFNLLDNLNGLSGGIAAISSVFFCIIAFFDGDYLTAALAAGIAGSCIGFLKYNFPKASIFMGDSGSLVLGFLLACLAIIGSWGTEKISLSLSIPIIILGYAIFDTTLVTAIRAVEKRSIFQGGKDHSSHILAFVGLKKKRAVLLIFTVSFLLGISGLIVKYSPAVIGLTSLFITALGMCTFGLRLFYLRGKMVRMRNAKQRKT
jgi:UDP-GlcNAc:undecaprenyl-phosphate GlcNAc-1-phosphate transferase